MINSAAPPYRFEFKYLVTPQMAKLIEMELKNFGMKLDAPGVLLGDGYYVTSLYFDSYDFKDYQDKCGGFLERKKIRARIYEPFLNESQSVWLELKKKNNDQVLKTRLRLNRGEWENFMIRGPLALMALKRGGRENDVKNEILWNMIAFSAKPKIVIRYKRKPLVAQSGNLRVTLDSGLEACRKADLGYNNFMVAPEPIRKSVILEVKSNFALPQWLGNLIWNYNLKKDAISKYAHGVEAVFRYNPLSR